MSNVGGLDRILRLIFGIVALVAPFIPALDAALLGLGAWKYGLSAVGAVLILTSLLRFCPAYVLLGIRTCPMPEPDQHGH
jgi:hypothetical protein